MKKRMFALFAVCVLLFSMSVTAFAKPSPQGGRMEFFDDDGKKIPVHKVEEDEWNNTPDCDHGTGCNGVIEIITPVISEFRDEIESLDIKDFVKGDYVKVFEAYIHGKGCVHWPVSVRIDALDWIEGKPVIMFYDVAQGKWIMLDYEVRDGYFYLEKINQSGPLVFFLEKKAVDTESPKTGDPVSLAAATFVLGAAGVLAFSKKRDEE